MSKSDGALIEERKMEKRRIAQRRAMELKTTIQDYQKAQKTIPTGFQQWDRILKQQERIKEYFGATDEEWQNWHSGNCRTAFQPPPSSRS